MGKILFMTYWDFSASILLLMICSSKGNYSVEISSFSVPNQQEEPQILFQSTSISSQTYPFNKPQIIETRRMLKIDPYSIFPPSFTFTTNQVAQKRLDLAAAASIVPNPLPILGKDPFWVPHRYYNLCPFVPPGQDTLWSVGCYSNPYPNLPTGTEPEGIPLPPSGAAVQQPYSYPGAHTHSTNPFFPSGFPAAMTPFYANMGYPQIVSNAQAVDAGNLFAYASTSSNGPNVDSFNPQVSTANSALFFNPLVGNSGNGGALYSTYGGSGLQPVPFPFGLPFFNSGSNWNRIQVGQGSDSNTFVDDDEAEDRLDEENNVE